MNRNAAVSIIILIFGTGILFSQASVPDIMHAYKIDYDIDFDGRLLEKCWQEAPRISNFTQRELNNGSPATEKTDVAIVYNTNTMYIGVWCYDNEPDKIIAKYMERDFSWGSEDNFEIVFDTYKDNRNGYLFVINPNGARADGLISNGGRDLNTDWNGIWDVETTVTDSGWFAEIVIPFSTFKYPDQPVQTWGLNMERNISRKLEQDLWQGWSRDYSLENIAQAGTLEGLKNIAGYETIELKPYITTGYQNTSKDPDNKVARIGGDANYLLTPTLKLNLTFNTDFAQVESDRHQINLTRFDIFYPEKREFFLEGSRHFNFSTSGHVQLFYSRRIGLNDEGEEVPIIAGARLMGKEGSTNIGALTMQTAEKAGEPSTNYTAVRLKEDVFDNSYVGMILTAKNNKDHYNYAYGLDYNYYTQKFLGDKQFTFLTAMAQTFTKDKSNKQNLSYRVYAAYPNDLVYVDAGIVGVPKDFNPEIGYVRRSDFTSPFGNFIISPRFDNSSWLRQISFKLIGIDSYINNTDHRWETVSYSVKPLGVAFRSGDQFNVDISKTIENLKDPFSIVKGDDSINIKPGKYSMNKVSFSFQSFTGRPLTFGASTSIEDFWGGTKNSYGAWMSYNVNRHLNLSADYYYDNIDHTDAGFYTNNMSARVVYAFTPKVNTSIFGQWNNDNNKIMINYRFNWIPVVGSDFYFAFNQMIDTKNAKWNFEDMSVFAKFIWRFGL